jgi:hypothetical protein
MQRRIKCATERGGISALSLLLTKGPGTSAGKGPKHMPEQSSGKSQKYVLGHSTFRGICKWRGAGRVCMSEKMCRGARSSSRRGCAWGGKHANRWACGRGHGMYSRSAYVSAGKLICSRGDHIRLRMLAQFRAPSIWIIILAAPAFDSTDTLLHVSRYRGRNRIWGMFLL